MKKLKLALLCVSCFFYAGVNAQDYPVISEDDDRFIITIPYAEYEDQDGDTKALTAELVASKASSALSFSVNDSALKDVGVDSPAKIKGSGACSRTTKAQFRACKADVQDDFYEGQAKCFNVSDEEEQEECLVAVEDERLEAREECGDVEEAHDNLCAVLGEDPYDPDLDAITFVSLAAIIANPNPFFPLIPGNIWVYEAEDETITVTVLDETRDIMGIESVVVRDTVEEDGELVEDTMDWYAQDDEGNVWYMGELSLNYEDGELTDLDGSWETGKEGAKPGILFRAMPVIGEVYRQEYLIGEAEDVAETIALDADESTDSGYACAGGCLQNLEYTPLESGSEEFKFYLPGTGMIVESKPESGERVELVDFTPGN